ncbi:MAG TPA: diguanylate cyclase [Gammaproteobacteria bacterium]|nr:diguanylate cyclase [Gammaproteobacteria bacterium]
MIALPNKPWTSPLAAAVVTLLVTGGLGYSVVRSEDAAFQAREQARVAEHVESVRAALEREIGLDTGALAAFEALIETRPEITDAEFQNISAVLTRDVPAIREIQLSPGGIVRDVYPESAAAAVRGLDIRTLPEQKGVVLQTIQDGKTRVAGPLELVQGGVGLVARDPIYTGKAKTRRFWGFVTVVLDYRRFLKRVPALTDDPDVEFALRGKDGLGASGVAFFGDETLFQQRAVTADVILPSGHWQLAGLPKGGWHSAPLYSTVTRTLVLLCILIMSGLSFLTRQRGVAMERVATRDTLTGALRRHAFIERAEAEIRRAIRYPRPLSLLWFDVDHFKQVNDRWGHAGGDLALKTITRAAIKELRPSDIFGRMGGEEFALLCPETNLEQAKALAERLRERIAALPMLFSQDKTNLTVSFGVVDLREGRDSLRMMLSAADKALYRAKDEGRNRVCVG